MCRAGRLRAGPSGQSILGFHRGPSSGAGSRLGGVGSGRKPRPAPALLRRGLQQCCPHLQLFPFPPFVLPPPAPAPSAPSGSNRASCLHLLSPSLGTAGCPLCARHPVLSLSLLRRAPAPSPALPEAAWARLLPPCLPLRWPSGRDRKCSEGVGKSRGTPHVPLPLVPRACPAGSPHPPTPPDPQTGDSNKAGPRGARRLGPVIRCQT